jgi:hypothetical protein
MMDTKEFKVGDFVRCNCGCSKDSPGQRINAFRFICGMVIAVFSKPDDEIVRGLPLDKIEHAVPEKLREPDTASVEFIAGKIEGLKNVRDVLGVSPDQHARINASITSLEVALVNAYIAENDYDIFVEMMNALFGALEKSMGGGNRGG